MAKPLPKKRRANTSPVVEAGVEETGIGSAWKFFAAFAILLLFLAGYAWYNNYRADQVVVENQYNGFDFSEAQGGIWVTRIYAKKQPYDIPFYFHPRDTESVLVDPNATHPLWKSPGPQEVVISVDPESKSKVVIAGIEVARILGTKYDLYNFPTSSALSRATNATADMAVINCLDATDDRVVIQFIEGKQNLITRYPKNQNCIVLQYTDVNESVRVADRFAYMLLKIM